MKTQFCRFIVPVALRQLRSRGSSAPQADSPTSTKYAGATPLEWSQRMADSEMARKGDSLAWKPGRPGQVGLHCRTVLRSRSSKLNEQAHDPRYLPFATNAVGSFISNDGQLHTYNHDEYQLDALNPGKTVLLLAAARRRRPRYTTCASMLRYRQINTQPRTPDGGFWHKQRLRRIKCAARRHFQWGDTFYKRAPVPLPKFLPALQRTLMTWPSKFG